MIVCHKHRFIFIKTIKTAGTSMEVLLSQWGGPDDVVTKIWPLIDGHVARNWRGLVNPIPDLRRRHDRPSRVIGRALLGVKYYNHMPAWAVRRRVGEDVWNSYFKFCFDRNPWEKAVSHWHMKRKRRDPNMTFDDYLWGGHYAHNYPLYADPDQPGKLLVDFVGKYENLAADLAHVAERLNIPFSGSLDVFAKSDYRSDRRPYQEVFTPKQRDRVVEIFHDEIDLLGYTFD